MITEDYVSFEVAKLLKEKGFDENTLCKYAGKDGVTEEWYDDYRERMIRFDWDEGHLIEPLTEPEDKYGVYGDTIPAPTLQMVMKWLREVHNLFIQVTIVPYTTVTMEQKYYLFSVCKNRRNLINRSDHPHDSYSTYEEACETAIKYCLENLI